jgi:hypothetical protein
MFKLDDNLLRELGLGELPAAEKNKMLAHIYETLEMRVGMKLAEQMSNQQLDEFESYIDRNDEAGALKWLETNFPNYKQVVAEELDKLKKEISTAAPQIVAASRQDQAQNTVQSQPPAQRPLPPQNQPFPPAPSSFPAQDQPMPPSNPYPPQEQAQVPPSSQFPPQDQGQQPPFTPAV